MGEVPSHDCNKAGHDISGLAPFLWRLENMSRTFKKVDYDQALDLTVRLGDCLPPNHLARFVVDSLAQLDLSALYAKYGSRGGEPYAPEMLLGLLLYSYTTGVFSSRKIERATYESVAFRFIAGNAHPDHDTLAAFRRTFLPELKDLFAQILLLAKAAGVLKLGTISLDGTKVHADARHSESSQLQTFAGVGDAAPS
jgi:transposase